MRVNHVGDWGTQFGMLITYLQEQYPDILNHPPNISDLTLLYKASKKRFDEDIQFKETSRLNVVKLQSGDHACRAIWQLLCNISRTEFQKVYDILQVKLFEMGESFYNPMIPQVIEELKQLEFVKEDDGMLIFTMPHFTIPLILRKSDGGYGYDSTDMAALHYRLFELQREWVIVITDAGQATHFYMCFDAARSANWLVPGKHRVDHIGFGVVCGDDGKRFKTRSSETVRLIDLLNTAKDKMKESLLERVLEGKSPLQADEIDRAAGIIGYGAVKYFDLKNNPSTNYIFKYERMLDTKGDTAVYLLFAYARLSSILRKVRLVVCTYSCFVGLFCRSMFVDQICLSALVWCSNLRLTFLSSTFWKQAKEERNIDVYSAMQHADELLDLSHPAGSFPLFSPLFDNFFNTIITPLYAAQNER